MERYLHIVACLCYLQSITLALPDYFDVPENFEIYVNGKQLNDETLRLIQGTNANLSCIYRNDTVGRWKINQSPAYFKDPLSTENLKKNNAGEYACFAKHHRRRITLDVLYPPENATIIGPDVVEFDDHLELTCAANANPAPSFVWIEDGLTIGNGSSLSIRRHDNALSFVCNVQNKMIPTFGDAVYTSATARKSVKFEGNQKETVSSTGSLIAAAVLGWTVAMVVSCLAIAKYLRERDVLTKLQNELERHKKTEFSKPLLPNAMGSCMNSSDECRTTTETTQRAPRTIQLSEILESDNPGVTLPPPIPPERPAETLPSEGKPQPQYLDLDSPEKDGRVESGADYTYEDIEKRPVEQRYDDLDESAMDNTRQSDGYEQPIESSRTIDSAVDNNYVNA